NFAQALGDNLGVLLVKLLQAVELGLVLAQVLLQRCQFFGVMRAVGFVIRRGRGLKHSLKVLPLAVLAFDLIFEKRDLTGELPVGVVRLVRLRLRVADAALDDRLVDRIGFGGLLSHQAEPDEYALDCSQPRFRCPYCFFEGGSSSSNRLYFWRLPSS